MLGAMYLAVRDQSLHTQGTPIFSWSPPGFRRSIPAYSGNTLYAEPSAQPNQINPCILREHNILDVRIVSVEDQSLHTQGTPGYPSITGYTSRSIPAYSGNTVYPVLRSYDTRINPCILRGTPLDKAAALDISRSIPAYSGNT